MNKITQMFNNLKSAVNSMDKKNKAILSIVTIAVIGAMTFAGYSLTTIGKSVDNKVKHTDTVSEKDKKKETSDTKKKDDENVDQKGEKEAKESSKTNTDNKEKSEKKSSKESKTSTSTNKTSSNSKTSNKSDTNGSTSNKANSLNGSGSSSSSSSTSNNNTQQTTKPKPAPKPEPAPQPSEPTQEEVDAMNEQAKKDIIAQAEQSPGGLFKTMDEAEAWACAQANDPNSPYYGKTPGAGEVGMGSETFGYVGYFY
ncbi:hypothetical protein MKC54_09730 [[Clostridium] innocuum]|nr:hypothetical protein [[Clostridium] innocuum]MCR0577166.1 hypothetical protein [[Clostridium] innocuum]